MDQIHRRGLFYISIIQTVLYVYHIRRTYIFLWLFHLYLSHVKSPQLSSICLPEAKCWLRAVVLYLQQSLINKIMKLLSNGLPMKSRDTKFWVINKVFYMTTRGSCAIEERHGCSFVHAQWNQNTLHKYTCNLSIFIFFSTTPQCFFIENRTSHQFFQQMH